MYDKNYEEYMSTVLGYNINQENTYCNYDYDNFSYEKITLIFIKI